MRKELIESYINSLRTSLGPVRSPATEDILRLMYNQQDYAGMVGHIKNHLSLDLRIRLGLANKGGPNAPAWVDRPREMPLFGTSSFRQLVVTVYLRKSFLANGYFEAVVCAIAHELCHIVLSALRHPLHLQEEAVDLTAMLLGFRDFYITGCRSVRDVSSPLDTLVGRRVIEARTQGYLSFDEVSYAAAYMTYH